MKHIPFISPNTELCQFVLLFSSDGLNQLKLYYIDIWKLQIFASLMIQRVLINHAGKMSPTRLIFSISTSTSRRTHSLRSDGPGGGIGIGLVSVVAVATGDSCLTKMKNEGLKSQMRSRRCLVWPVKTASNSDLKSGSFTAHGHDNFKILPEM